MNDLISIIIVNYNGRKWLKKLFDSLFSQTHKNFEIIFVDNASNDDSIEFIKDNYNDDKIKIIKSKKNLGFSSGNNLGIKQAKGEYILLINNDTWVKKDFLKKLVNFYKNNSFDIIGPIEADYHTKKFEVYSIYLDLFGHYIYKMDGIGGSSGFYLSGVCLFFTKEFYYQTKGLDNNFFMYGEDWDWFWRLHLLNKKIFQINDLYVYHMGAGSTGSGIKYLSFLWRNQNALQMLLKNYELFTLLWVLPIYFIQNIFEMIFFILILKPRIAYSYVEGWLFNIKNMGKILEERKWVQKNRLISDFKIMKKMYIGFGKIEHFKNYFFKSTKS